jgi:hypothetical protein
MRDSFLFLCVTAIHSEAWKESRRNVVGDNTGILFFFNSDLPAETEG